MRASDSMNTQGVEFFLPFAPVAWERARSCGKRFYTAPKSAAYKASIRNILDRNKKHFVDLYLMPLEIDMTFALVRPLKCKRLFPAVRPDLDNYAKSVLDAMNEIVFKDDGQVVKLTLMKVYADAGTGTNVIVRPLPQEPNTTACMVCYKVGTQSEIEKHKCPGVAGRMRSDK